MKAKAPMKRQAMKRRPPKQRDNEFSPEVRALAEFRAGYRCEFPGCSRGIDQHHHIWRRGQGGPGTLDNDLCLCMEHHSYIHANSAESFERGWLRHPPARG